MQQQKVVRATVGTGLPQHMHQECWDGANTLLLGCMHVLSAETAWLISYASSFWRCILVINAIWRRLPPNWQIIEPDMKGHKSCMCFGR